MLLASILVFNGRSGNRSLEVKRAAQEMVADIRLAQNYALSARDVECTGDDPNRFPSYGLNAKSDEGVLGEYIIYGDCVGNKNYQGVAVQGGDLEIKTVKMEKVAISAVSPGGGSGEMSVLFDPPVPTTTIFPNSSSFTITLRHLDDATKCLRVQGNNKGSVWVNETACPSP